MTHSPFVKKFVTRIDGINDQLWYFLFTSEEVTLKLSGFSSTALQNYTTDLFYLNQFSSRIHVQGSRLQNFYDRSKSATFGSLSSTAYEIAANYLKDIFHQIVGLNALTGIAWNNRQEPERNLSRLFHTMGVAPPSHILPTFSYLRHKRNHFIHIMNVPNAAATGFIAAQSTSLNNYWVNSAKISNTNFADVTQLTTFDQNRTIEMLYMLRIVLLEIDKFIIQQLTASGIISFLLHQEYDTKPSRLNADIRKTRVKNIIGLARTRFGRNVTETECIPLVNTIGIR